MHITYNITDKRNIIIRFHIFRIPNFCYVDRLIIAGDIIPNNLDDDVLNCTIKIDDLYIIFPPMIVDKLYQHDFEESLQDFNYLLNYGTEMQQKIYKEIDFNPRNFPDQQGYIHNNGK